MSSSDPEINVNNAALWLERSPGRHGLVIKEPWWGRADGVLAGSAEDTWEGWVSSPRLGAGRNCSPGRGQSALVSQENFSPAWFS